MDRILHNEGLFVASVLSAILSDVHELARIDIIAVLSVDTAIRKRSLKYNDYDALVSQESMFSASLNRKFREFQPMILNSLSMMLQLEMISIDEQGNYKINHSGVDLYKEFLASTSSAIMEVAMSAKTLSDITKNLKTQKIYMDLKIVL